MTDKPSGTSYRDPAYANIETGLEKEYGLPAGGLGAIRTQGERSNSDAVSSAGARSVYQITPATRQLFMAKYGVDAYASPSDAAKVAALHLRDGMRRTGTWAGAVTDYIGGPDASKHGPTTAAYVARVTGQPVPTASDPKPTPVLDWGKMSVDQIMHTTPESVTAPHLGPQRKDPAQSPLAIKQATTMALTGGKGVLEQAPASYAPDLTAADASEAAQVADTKDKAQYGFVDRMSATLAASTFADVIRGMDKASTHFDSDPTYHAKYVKHADAIEGVAQNTHELGMIRSAQSSDELGYNMDQIYQARLRDRIIDSNGTGGRFRLAGGLIDPVGWVAGMGVGKVADMMGVGANILSHAAEASAANIAITATSDMAGNRQSAGDYMESAITGLAIGAALHGFGAFNNAAHDAARLDNANRLDLQRRTEQATANLGPSATPDDIINEATRIKVDDVQNYARIALSPIPDHHMFMPIDSADALISTKAVLDKVVGDKHLGSVADDAARAIIAEHVLRTDKIVRENPIDKDALKTLLSKVGQEGTATRLLASDNNVLKAVGISLLESATGAAGRRNSAAISKLFRERIYKQHVIEYEHLFHEFRQSSGVGRVRALWDGEIKAKFDDRVYNETLNREGTPKGQTFDSDPSVNRAADVMERGYDVMRAEQKHVGTVGSVRLPETARGYLPRMLDPAKVLDLQERPEQMTKVRGILAKQFKELNDYTFYDAGEPITKKYDDEFANTMAAAYIERAINKGKGAVDIPVNVNSPDAASAVRDTLEAVLGKDNEAEIDKLMGKYSRGGASHTKSRLNLDMQEDIGNGQKLGDLFNKDVMHLYHRYAQRVSGEVSLAQYGIMGDHGIQMLRRAAVATGAANHDLKAFDQVMAEFMGKPTGTRNSPILDDIRAATSASRLGSMAITQLGETGNGIAAVGVQRVFSSIAALPRLVTEIRGLAKGGESQNMWLKDIDGIGGNLAMDDYHFSKMWDVKEAGQDLYSSDRVGLFSRAVRSASHLQAIVGMHRALTAAQTRGMAEQVIQQAVHFAEHGTNTAAMIDMGFTPELQSAIKRNLGQIVERDANGKAIGLNLTVSGLTAHEQKSIAVAVNRGSSQIIQRTYIGETGPWAHDGMLKLLGQFRTFSVISVEKQWGRQVKVQGGGALGAAKAFGYLMGSMSFALPLVLGRMYTHTIGMTDDAKKKYLDGNLNAVALGRATMNYASASGLLGDVMDLGMGAASDLGMVDPSMAPMQARGQSAGQLIGGVVAPGVGLMQDVWDGIHVKRSADGAFHMNRNARKLLKTIPGSNMPGVSNFITGVTAD